MSSLTNVLMNTLKENNNMPTNVNNVNVDTEVESEDSPVEVGIEEVVEESELEGEGSKFLLVDTKPDRDTEWKETYICGSWREAYEKMVCLLFDVSPNDLEASLTVGRAFIKIYSAQTYDIAGDRRVFYIICL